MSFFSKLKSVVSTVANAVGQAATSAATATEKAAASAVSVPVHAAASAVRTGTDVVSHLVPDSPRNALGELGAILICPPVALGVIATYGASKTTEDVTRSVLPSAPYLRTLEAFNNAGADAGTAIASHPKEVGEVALGTALLATGVGGAAGGKLIAQGAATIAFDRPNPNTPVETLVAPRPRLPVDPSLPSDQTGSAEPLGFFDWLSSLFK
jgi:hypothetical protein